MSPVSPVPPVPPVSRAWWGVVRVILEWTGKGQRNRGTGEQGNRGSGEQRKKDGCEKEERSSGGKGSSGRAGAVLLYSGRPVCGQTWELICTCSGPAGVPEPRDQAIIRKQQGKGRVDYARFLMGLVLFGVWGGAGNDGKTPKRQTRQAFDAVLGWVSFYGHESGKVWFAVVVWCCLAVPLWTLGAAFFGIGIAFSGERELLGAVGLARYGPVAPFWDRRLQRKPCAGRFGGLFLDMDGWQWRSTIHASTG